MGWLQRLLKKLFRAKGALRRGLQRLGKQIARRQGRIKQLEDFITRNRNNTNTAVRRRVQKAQEALMEQQRKLADDVAEQKKLLDELDETPTPDPDTSPRP